MLDRVSARPKQRFFYGWRIVASAFVTVGITQGLRTYVFGVFVKPLSESQGWSRAEIVGVLTAQAVLAGILAPFVGRHVDRHGPRTGMIFGALLGGVALLALSRVDSLWQWYVFWLVYTVGDSLAGITPTNIVLSNWFVRMRGKAMGIAYVATSVGGLILVPTVTAIVMGAGWNWGFVFLGLVILLVMAPVSGIIMRRRPEDLGLRPDGALPDPAARATGPLEPARSDEPDWTPRLAVRTAPFWLLALAAAFGNGTSNVVSVHAMSLATDLGIPAATAAGAVGLLLFVALPGRFLYSWLCDRMDIRHVMMLYMSGLLVAALVLSQMHSLITLYVSVVIFGLSVGGVNPVPPIMAARLYGRKNIGRIWGTIFFLAMPMSSGGPLLAGYIFDRTGSYQWAFYICAVGLIASIVGIYFVRPQPIPSGIQTSAIR